MRVIETDSSRAIDWHDAMQRALAFQPGGGLGEILSRPLNISTITMMYKPLPSDFDSAAELSDGCITDAPASKRRGGVCRAAAGITAGRYPKYNIEVLMQYLLDPANKSIIDGDFEAHVGSRPDVRLNNPAPNLISVATQHILGMRPHPDADGTVTSPPPEPNGPSEDGLSAAFDMLEKSIESGKDINYTVKTPSLADEEDGDNCYTGFVYNDVGGDNNSLNSGGKKHKKGTGHFLNQLTMSYTDEHSTKSIKVFSNRTIHITGCKSPAESRVVATLVWSLLCRVYPDTRDIQYTQEMVMVNATCELNYSFNPNKNQRVMSEQYKDHIVMVSTGKKTKYPGTILKLPAKKGKYVTVLMFTSGNLMFTCRALSDMVDAYAFVLGYYSAEREGIMSREPIRSKRKIEEARPKRKYVMQKQRKNARKINYVVI